MSLLPSSYAVDATRYRSLATQEDAIENALKAKLQARAAQRRAQEMMARRRPRSF